MAYAQSLLRRNKQGAWRLWTSGACAQALPARTHVCRGGELQCHTSCTLRAMHFSLNVQVTYLRCGSRSLQARLVCMQRSICAAPAAGYAMGSKVGGVIFCDWCGASDRAFEAWQAIVRLSAIAASAACPPGVDGLSPLLRSESHSGLSQPCFHIDATLQTSWLPNGSMLDKQAVIPSSAFPFSARGQKSETPFFRPSSSFQPVLSVDAVTTPSARTCMHGCFWQTE